MTANQGSADYPAPNLRLLPLGYLLALAVACLLLAFGPGWLWRWPAEWVLPARLWVTDAFRFLANDLDFGLFTFRELTRGFAWLLGWPLTWAEGLLFKGIATLGLPPIPWIALAGGAALLGHWLGGWRLALLAGGGVCYLAVFGVWQDAMRTLALVIITVPLAAGTGLAIGLLALSRPRLERLVTALFDVMQSTPHLAYLAPVAVFFGFGAVPGLIATGIFAMPPMARCTLLGLRTVPAEVIEAGTMAGCTPRQLLWRVRLPAAQQTLLVGLNQVVMQTLAMVVIASLIGASGLGHKLLFSLQQLQLGRAVENGVAIVIIAVVLDRLSQAFARRTPAHEEVGSWLARHWRLTLFLALLLGSYLLAPALPVLRQLPRDLTITTAPFWDQSIRWLSMTLFDPLAILRDDLTVQVLIPLRNFFLWLPWSAVAGGAALIGWRLGGWRLALLVFSLLAAIALTGFWTPAAMTIYLTTLALIVCAAIGIPLGIWAAHRPRAARVVLTVCDTLQTFPSFIYLIPVIMLFRVGDLAALVAIIGYAMVPAVRYTHLGLTRIPSTVLEAARAAGATRRQLLWKVELPMALPEILLGLTQTVLMALAMTAITALIGSRDLGQEILKALPEVDTGRGLLAGLSIAAIGIAVTRLVEAWALPRKRELGL